VQRIIQKTEMLILSAFISDTRRNLFHIKDKIIKKQSVLFNTLDHSTFQSIEMFISSVTARIDKKQRATHEKKWEHLLKAYQGQTQADKVEVNDTKLVVSISRTTLTEQ
jgi:hypothetical protein